MNQFLVQEDLLAATVAVIRKLPCEDVFDIMAAFKQLKPVEKDALKRMERIPKRNKERTTTGANSR